MPIPNITSKVSKIIPGTLVPTETLVPMVTHALALVKRAHENAKPAYKSQWFGQRALNDPDINDWTEKMYKYLNGGLKTLNISCCSTVDSIASCAQYAGDKVRGGKEKPPTVRNIQLNAGFNMDRYSYGERVGSILHEITHLCIGTNDEMINNVNCYGAPLCVQLALTQPLLAMTNADNWGYYFTNYHLDLGLQGDDWKYLTAAEVLARV